MKLYQHIKTIADLQDFFAGLEPNHPLSTIEMEDQDWVMVVDSSGNTKKVASKHTRILFFSIELVTQ